MGRRKRKERLALNGVRPGKNLAALLAAHPELISVLNRHGVHVCPGCCLTLTATPRQAAAYHAVPNVSLFIKEVIRAVRKG